MVLAMNRLQGYTPQDQQVLTSVFIMNIGHPVTVQTREGHIWGGILEGYNDDGLLVTNNDNPELMLWRYGRLKSLTAPNAAYKTKVVAFT